MASIAITVSSAGTLSGNRASFTLAGQVLNMSYGRGLNVMVLDQGSGAVLFTQCYDTSGSAQQSELFAGMIEQLPIGRVVAIAVQGDGSAQLSDRARFACQTLGSALIYNLGSQSSWGLVGMKGAPAGSVQEQMDQTGKVELVVDQPLVDPEQIAYRVRLYSAGYSVGNDFWIEVNGQRLKFEGSSRGFNVAVFDALSCQLLSQHNFDTWGSTAAVQQFVTLVSDLPEGQFVAVAVKDEASAQLNEQARVALESLGSGLIRQLQYRDSYVLFGQKNADPGSAAESLSSSLPVFAEAWMMPRTPVWRGFAVSTLCATPTSGAICQSYVDGIVVGSLEASTSGLIVTVLDEQTGIKLSSAEFDPQHDASASASLAQYISSVSTGRIVVISSTMGVASFLQREALQACTLVGSAQIFNAHNDSSVCWCVIGRKGASPGSVAECSGHCGTALQFWVLPTPSTQRFYADLRVVSAGFEAGNLASLSINGHEPGQCSRGMNVAVFDEQIGSLLQVVNFDTYASPSAADAFAALLEGLAAGRIVAIAVLDEASVSLTERARRACESIGSGCIRQLGVRGSWAIVGIKGAPIGSVPEAIGTRMQTSRLSYQLFTAAAKELPGVSVRCHSAGFTVGNSAFVSINGQTVERTSGRWLNVVVIDQSNGQVTQSETFDTYGSSAQADAFATLIERLPYGTLVAIAVADEATLSLTERAKRACRMIGSEAIDQLGFRQSWAIVGIKGSGPGSASEILNVSGACEALSWLPLVGGRKRFIQVLVVIVIFAIVATSYLAQSLPPDDRPAMNSTLPTPPSPGTSVPLPPNTPPTTSALRKAVFVAINYAQVPGLGLETYPTDILEDVQRTLVNTGTIIAGNTKFLFEAAADPKLTPTRANVEAALRDLLDKASPQDMLYFHYLGHGGQDTTVSPPREYLITLTNNLKARQVFMDSDLEPILRSIGQDISLTLVFHCCFGGGIADGSAIGRGIALCAVDDVTPANLSRKGADMSGALAVRIKQSYRSLNPKPLPTYTELGDFIKEHVLPDTPKVVANPTIYKVDKLLVFEPFSLQIDGLAYLQGAGDRYFGSDEFVGTRDGSLMVEGFRLQFDPLIPGLGLSYMAHIQNLGDQAWVDGGTFIGTRTASGDPLRLEGFAIKLTGSAAPNYTVMYMAHLQGKGDTAWVADGAFCGTRGESRRVEGMQVIVRVR